MLKPNALSLGTDLHAVFQRNTAGWDHDTLTRRSPWAVTDISGSGALERRGRGLRDLGLAGLHGHRHANSSVRTSKRHIRRVIIAGDVVMARGAIIAVEDAAGESRICAIADVHRSTSL